MSTTLNLARQLLSMGRRFQDHGRGPDALRILGRLAKLRELPADVAEETHARLGEMQLDHEKFARARRHLTTALGYQPANPHYYRLLATAIDHDAKADPQRAAAFYRRSLRLDPDQPACQVEYGLLALRLGEVEEGLSALRKAAELAPDDPDVVGPVIEGLCDEGHDDEARQMLLAARFRNARDERFQRLWTDFRFRQLKEAQDAAERAVPGVTVKPRPMVLPFVRPDGDGVRKVGRQRVRRDAATALAGPHGPRSARLPDKKQA
jgi:tetratricopeptide (TPR) repeat protein